MRIVELLESKKLKKAAREALPYAKQYSEIDSFYDMYRLGVGMAGGPDSTDGYQQGPANTHPSVIMYSDAEEEIVSNAERALGIKGRKLAAKGQSSEMSHINTTSPVANWNKK